MVPKLIPDWRRAWRFNSVRLAAVLTILSLVQAQLLPQIQPIVPAKYWPYVTAGVGALIVVFRIVRQAALYLEGEQPQEPQA